MIPNQSPPKKTLSQRLLRLFSSMDLAITLLVTLAIASVIGTVLQQNQPYPDYIIKFGPFWFEVFKSLGLYDVYSAIWFLLILALLVISTSVCLTRHVPSMLKDMFQLRTNVQKKSLSLLTHKQSWQSSEDKRNLANDIIQKLRKVGFKARLVDKGDDLLVTAMSGGLNRLGYILTHLAIIVICLGGLFDSNLPLKLAEWQGRIEVETESMPLSQVPEKSRLPVGPQSFRGSVSIPEGKLSGVSYLAMRDGYLVQSLPFIIEVKDFRIEHYSTGQPKSFESDLVIHDSETDEKIEQTISVNHPLSYKGYTIYQASFGDGGSQLSIDAWPLQATKVAPVPLQTTVFDTQKMLLGDSEMLLEFTDFRPFNINPDPTENDPKNVRNDGPSFTFKMRKPTGEAIEYQNYMFPVEREGRFFLLSGMRASPSEPFAYLYLPLDEDDSPKTLFAFLERLYDINLVEQLATQMKNETLASLEVTDLTVSESLQQTLVTLVKMFSRGGYAEVNRFIAEALPEDQREKLAPTYLSMLREMLMRVFFANLTEKNEVDEDDLLFFQDAVDAVGSLPRYQSPVYLQLTDYKHIQSTGLQVAHSAGKNIVYLGCAFLVAGVFLLFYLPQRRIWVWLHDGNLDTDVLLAGMTNRNPRDFDQYFNGVVELLSPSGNSMNK